MDTSRWEKVAAATGIVFVILLLGSSLIVPTPPKLSDPAVAVAAYYTQHRNGVLWAMLLGGGLGAVSFLWWLGSLRIYLRRRESDGGRLSGVAFGSGLVGIVILVLVLAMRAGLAFAVAKRADPSVTAAVFNISYAADAFNPFVVGTLLLAASISAGRSRAFPAWLAWAGGAIGVVRMLTGFDIVLKESILGDEGALGAMAFLLVLAWIVAASVVMIHRTTPLEGNQHESL